MYSMKNLAKTGYIICLFLILALFCYFRVKPVYFQTVPYTFDQGRDFLKTQEIVIYKQPALLGPTTGIPGVNHGVWWYYFLTIPFFVTNGNPMGFYYFILLLALAQLVLFTVFLKKDFLCTKKRFLYFVSGLLLPIAPRILFELKSGFSQTQLVLKYFNETSVQASKTYSEVFWERFHLLKDFFLQSFPGQIQFLMWSTLCLIIIGIFFSFSNLKKLRKEFFLFTLILFVGLFVLSLLYKTVFWQNYFEGLPYFFVVFSALSVSALLRSQKTVLKIIVYVYVVVLILSLGTTFAQELQNKESPKLEGLREHMEVSKIIYADSKNDELCIKVYTPPIIPHTYRYLFAYFERIGKPKVKEAFINDSCYLILEKDNCKFLPIEVNEMRECKSRQDRWKAIHVPKGSKLLKEIKPNDHVLIEKWRGKELP